MFGVPLEGPAQVFCDNQGIVKNPSVPESVLTKKHNAINYHTAREAAVAGILEVIKDETQTNLADLFAKGLHADRRCERLGSMVYNLWRETIWYMPKVSNHLVRRYLLRDKSCGLQCRSMFHEQWRKKHGLRWLFIIEHYVLYTVALHHCRGVNYRRHVDCVVDPNSSVGGTYDPRTYIFRCLWPCCVCYPLTS